MSVGLRHPLVRDYLERLDRALVDVPDKAELREQIASHLDDAIDPSMSEQEVRAELERLGDPATLVPVTGRRRMSWWRHIRPWMVVVVVIVLAAGITALVLIVPRLDAPPLNVIGYRWLGTDGPRAHTTEADGHKESRVIIRRGATQGFVLALVNSSQYTLTVEGWDSRNDRGPFGSTQYDLRLGPDSLDVPMGDDATAIRRPPVSIAPHSYRNLVVEWSSESLPCIASGSSVGFDTMDLRVRQGWFTRVQAVELPVEFSLLSTSAQPGC